MSGGEWLDDLPPETGDLDEIAPEDEIDRAAYDEAIRVGRGELVLGERIDLDLDQHGYDEALREERRGQRPPGYKEAVQPGESCGTCSYFDKGICGRFTYAVDADDVCADWDAAT